MFVPINNNKNNNNNDDDDDDEVLEYFEHSCIHRAARVVNESETMHGYDIQAYVS